MSNSIYQKNETILKVQDVSLKYGDKQILSNINFEIKNIIRPNLLQGQVVSLLGRSGIGKSQLFNILAGLNKPTTGSVLVNNNLRPVKAGDVGVVPQNYILFNHRTVRKNLSIAAEQNPQLKNNIKEAIEYYAQNFDLVEHLDKYPLELSGGQRQRVAIIRQLLNGCDFILFDEPFSGLDTLVLDKVIDILLKISLSDELKTLIIVSHDLENTVAISDTVFILSKKDKNIGATISTEIDLIERNLAWQSDVKSLPSFKETIKEIKSLL